MLIAGVDPGKRGAVAIVDEHGYFVTGEVLELIPRLDTWLQVHRGLGGLHVFIEKAQAFRGQGISSAFNYAREYGFLLGLLTAGGFPVTQVPPATWTKVMHAGTATAATAKERSAQAAQRLFPEANFFVGKSKKPHDGLVDAALIGAYGSRQLR